MLTIPFSALAIAAIVATTAVWRPTAWSYDEEECEETDRNCGYPDDDFERQPRESEAQKVDRDAINDINRRIEAEKQERAQRVQVRGGGSTGESGGNGQECWLLDRQGNPIARSNERCQ